MKRGRYPGGRKAGVYSERVWNGGASNRRVDDLWRAERREMEKEEGSRGKRSMRRNQVVVQESVDGNGEGKKWWRH